MLNVIMLSAVVLKIQHQNYNHKKFYCADGQEEKNLVKKFFQNFCLYCNFLSRISKSKLFNETARILNGKESTINRALGGSTYPG
jgi:hypothetical protein